MKKKPIEHTQLLVLSLLAGEDMYGYQMIVELARRSDHTFEMKEGTLYPVLHGSTSLMCTNVGNAPAKLLKKVIGKDATLPALKAAYVEETIYVGADQLEALAQIKSKNELIADVVALLQSPAKNVISALQSGGNKLHGILETLSNKE